ncbi:hypothetical protein [Brucella sp. JSBI001]|jgi:hypothetical protein|uniref:hypothetical protein n=1 Tax=Brucella sp. JSBI001 TaxID=2886044 RepID=UPI00124E38E3|nr:hypothetical protein [Brucella sp. JSBI001]KAB2669054.1 hypothetical protein F9K77_15745 [Ochrobactrum sp. LMG 5442]MBM7326641.1 hypothetical protein [Agrobacterium sp. S2]UZD69118.1 hypothetical protein LJ361_18680 [Brucella sp. JSBI001]
MDNLTLNVIEHMQARGDTIRRVYNLPTDLHARLLNYMAATGIDTEVEAVRRLLSDELNNHETADQAFSRLAMMQADEAAIAACGHPQVEGFRWSDSRDEFAIFLRNGRVIQYVDGFARIDNLPVRAVL